MICGDNIELKKISSEDNLDDYLDWMNDYEIVKYTESKGRSYSRQDLIDFIILMNNSIENHFWGIFADDKHIGNIKLGNIDFKNKKGDIGLIIGEKSQWGKGYATEAIKLLTEFAFNELNLKKVFANIYEVNKGSFNAFIKAGYQQCAIYKEHYFFEDKFIDIFTVEKINTRYKS